MVELASSVWEVPVKFGKKYLSDLMSSFITRAGEDFTYFSIDNWDDIKTEYGFTDDDMFKLFNESF